MSERFKLTRRTVTVEFKNIDCATNIVLNERCPKSYQCKKNAINLTVFLGQAYENR